MALVLAIFTLADEHIAVGVSSFKKIPPGF